MTPGPPDSPTTQPSAVTRRAAQRAEKFVREMRQRYPLALAQTVHFAEQKGQPGGMDWPDWCWLPMGASYAVICPTPGETLLPGDPRAADIARIAALTAWRLTKGVYWISDDALAGHDAAMWSRPGVPAERPLNGERVLSGLPQHCVYLAWPPQPPDLAPHIPLLGVFIHLEFDTTTGRPELRFLADTDGTWDGLKAFPVHLDRPTLLASAREQAGLTVRPGPSSEERIEEAAAQSWLRVFALWPAVEALITPAAVISNWDLPAERPQPASPHVKNGARRWKGADSPTRWLVTTHQPRPDLRTVPS